MAGMCKAVLIGNLGRDPEIRYTPDGLAVTNFSMAATERYKGEDRTEWFRISAFGKLAEICSQYLSKGKQVYIEGRLRTNEWEDQEGNKRFSVEVIANNMLMLGSKQDGAAGAGSYRPATSAESAMAAPPSQFEGPPSAAPAASSAPSAPSGPPSPESAPQSASLHQPPYNEIPEDDIPF